MKNAMKKIMSLMLVAVLLVSVFPMNASAAILGGGGEDYVPGDNQEILNNDVSTVEKDGQVEDEDEEEEELNPEDLEALGFAPFSMELPEDNDDGIIKVDVECYYNGVAYTVWDEKGMELTLDSDETHLTAEQILSRHYDFYDRASFTKIALAGNHTPLADDYKVLPGSSVVITVEYIPYITATVKYSGGEITDMKFYSKENTNLDTVLYKWCSGHEKMKNLRLDINGYTATDANTGEVYRTSVVKPGDNIIFTVYRDVISGGSGYVGGSGSIGGGNSNGGSSNGGNSNGGNSNGGSSNGGSYVPPQSGTVVDGVYYGSNNGANNPKFKYDIVLNVFLNNQVGSVHREFEIQNGIAMDGTVTLGEVETLLKNYYTAKDSSGLNVDGIYLATGNWVSSFSNDYNKYPRLERLDEESKYHEVNLIVMLTNANVKSTTTTSTSDNPKTGDSIMMTASVLGVSAAALAVLFFYNKKRAF